MEVLGAVLARNQRSCGSVTALNGRWTSWHKNCERLMARNKPCEGIRVKGHSLSLSLSLSLFQGYNGGKNECGQRTPSK